MTRTEVGEVAEPTGTGRGASSAMPHKRNPVLATMIRAAALQVPALSGALTQCLVSRGRAAGRRLARGVAAAARVPAAGGRCRLHGRRAGRGAARSTRSGCGRTWTISGSQVVSERISAVLAPRLGKAAAKDLLSRVSAETQRSDRSLAEVLAEAEELDGVLSADELTELCRPESYTGAAGALVDRALLDPALPR